MAHQNSGIKSVFVLFFLVLIIWDVFTTYYGTLVILDERNYPKDFIEMIQIAPLFNHIIGVLFALSIVIIIFCHKAILKSGNKLLKPLLYVAFIYDFGTSIIGTVSASNISYTNYVGLGVIVFFAVIVASSPIIITRITNSEEAL